MTNSTQQKRAVMLVPGKGGTGKTLFARMLYYALVEAGVKVVGFDSDTENPELANYHAQQKYQVYKGNLLEIEGSHKLLEMLEKKKPDVALIDMPAASGHQTRDRMEHFNLLDLSEDKEMPYRFTFVCVLDIGSPSVRSFQDVMAFCGDRADYVAVRNQFWEDGSSSDESSFAIWEQSEAYKLFESLKGIEIAMPALDRLTFQQMHPNTNFFDVAKLSVGHRLIAQSFLRRGVAELNYAASYLGLPASQVERQPVISATEAA
ncbi:hypothetical protein C7271_01480 [filamentous cyanobacterium CCP5]|nr:hypothetical protein C7271_01480 [filamentous cyanobacterium CCP5]